MHQQIDTIMHCGYKYNHAVTEKCAQKLLTISKLEGGKCVFLTSGSEAVEYGIQLAKKIRPNKKCICLKDQYLSAYGDCMQKSDQEWITLEWDYNDKKTLVEYYDEISSSINFTEVGVFELNLETVQVSLNFRRRILYRQLRSFPKNTM